VKRDSLVIAAGLVAVGATSMSAMTDQRQAVVNVEWVVIGSMMAIAGGILLLDRAGIVRAAGGWHLWPLILIGLGIRRMFRSQGEGRPHGGVLVLVGFCLIT
jgi:cell wall-active antibiotic response 4TMS protein YvqF